jgi:hypothetical protein
MSVFPVNTVAVPTSKRIFQANAIDFQTDQGVFFNGVPQTLFFKQLIPFNNVSSPTDLISVTGRSASGLATVRVGNNPGSIFYSVTNPATPVVFQLPEGFYPSQETKTSTTCFMESGGHTFFMISISQNGLVNIRPAMVAEGGLTLDVLEFKNWDNTIRPDMNFVFSYLL